MQRLSRAASAALLAGVAITAIGSAWLIGCAHLAILEWHNRPYASSFAGLGAIAQIATFVWLAMRRERSELAVAGVVGTLAFNSTMTLGVFGLTAHHNWIDPSANTIEAIATLLVPAILFPLAFKQTKRLISGWQRSDSDAHMDNVFAWRNLKRDLSNFQLLHHRNVDGNLVTGMNSGTHWVTVMLATAIAKHHGLALPKYFSFTAAGDLVGIPSALVRRPGIPAIALSHNHPAAPLAWPIVRKLVPIPKQVVLVRDIREVMVSAYVKWIPEREIPFADFVRGDPTNRRGYLCDVWWYLSYLNRWGDVKASAPDETLVVRYEDMVAEPALWLRRISDHFGLNLSDRAIEAALTLRDKDAALARRDPTDTERVIAAPNAKADVRFSEADLRELRSILSRHLRYDYGYDYGLKDTPLIPIRGLDLDAARQSAGDPGSADAARAQRLERPPAAEADRPQDARPRIVIEAFGDARVERAHGKAARAAPRAGAHAGQDFDGLVDRLHRIDGETSAADRLQHVVAQHEIDDVRLRDDHALAFGKPAHGADVEEAFDLLVGAADRLDDAALIDGAGDGEALLQRHVGDGGENGDQLRGRGAVAVDRTVGLLEGDAGRQRERARHGVIAVQIARNDLHAFRMRRAR